MNNPNLLIISLIISIFIHCSSEQIRDSSDGVCVSGNCIDGSGTKEYQTGDKYIGGFKEGLFHGFGRLSIVETGEIYTGEFKEGRKFGQGTLYDKDRKILYSGKWKNGNRIDQ
jgi:hypothetical protein